nr:hypothetical protein [Salinicola tamaricis]
MSANSTATPRPLVSAALGVKEENSMPWAPPSAKMVRFMITTTAISSTSATPSTLALSSIWR